MIGTGTKPFVMNIDNDEQFLGLVVFIFINFNLLFLFLLSLLYFL
jgi:hypothetical protein